LSYKRTKSDDILLKYGDNALHANDCVCELLGGAAYRLNHPDGSLSILDGLVARSTRGK